MSKIQVVISDFIQRTIRHVKVSEQMTMYGLLSNKCDWYTDVYGWERQYLNITINGKPIQHDDWDRLLGSWRRLNHGKTLFIEIRTCEPDGATCCDNLHNLTGNALRQYELGRQHAFDSLKHALLKFKDQPVSSQIPTNCKNCGAPLHGHICKYCDTEYW